MLIWIALMAIGAYSFGLFRGRQTARVFEMAPDEVPIEPGLFEPVNAVPIMTDMLTAWAAEQRPIHLLDGDKAAITPTFIFRAAREVKTP